MDMRYFGLFDMATVGVPVLVICVWQLVSINREIAKDKAARAASDPSPESARHSVGEHGLDDR